MKRIGLAIFIGITAALFAGEYAQADPSSAEGAVCFFTNADFTPTAVPPFLFGVGREQLEINRPAEAPALFQERVGILKDIKIKMLRGPCGTDANYYLWKKGYFFTSAEQDFEKYYPASKTIDPKRGAGPRPVFVADFYKEATVLEVPYVFDVNVISQSPEDIAGLVGEIKKLSNKPIFLEMGNELFEPNEQKTFPRCADYVAKVREIAKKAKEVEPSVKIGVVCPAYPFPEKSLVKSGLRSLANRGNQPIDRYLEWDKVLAANQDAFDAVILHPYIFFTHENATQESLMAYMFAFNQAGEDVICEDYKNLFPTKKIWATEFNVLNWAQFREKDKAYRNRIQMMKSPGAAIVNMETLLRFIDAGSVEVASIHTFCDSQGFGLICRWGEGYAKLPNYYVFEALGTLLDQFPVYYRLANRGVGATEMSVAYPHVQQGPELSLVKFDNVGAWGFGDKDGVKRVVILNRTPEPVKVEFASRKLKPLWTYGGRQIIPEFLTYSREWTAPPAINPKPDTAPAAGVERLELRPFSVTIAALEQ